jgi:hypothetical protein
VEGKKTVPADLRLPAAGGQKLADGTTQQVVVIQAEIANDAVVLGVRPLQGGNGVCTLEEVTLLPDGFA